MESDLLLWIVVPAVLVVAVLYSSVGHAGASGYIAVMSLVGMAPQEIRPAALILNVLVASIATYKFWRAGRFDWNLFWPFALLAMPMAYFGGYLNLPTQGFKILVGMILWFSAVQLCVRPPAEGEPRTPPRPAALLAGGGLGMLAGLTGTGGGIFLTPLLIFMRWSRANVAAGVSAPFILLNSLAGLAGNVTSTRQIPGFIWPLAIAVVIGGYVGSTLGSRHFSPIVIKRALAVVLAIAGAKLIFA